MQRSNNYCSKTTEIAKCGGPVVGNDVVQSLQSSQGMATSSIGSCSFAGLGLLLAGLPRHCLLLLMNLWHCRSSVPFVVRLLRLKAEFAIRMARARGTKNFTVGTVNLTVVTFQTITDAPVLVRSCVWCSACVRQSTTTSKRYSYEKITSRYSYCTHTIVSLISPKQIDRYRIAKRLLRHFLFVSTWTKYILILLHPFRFDVGNL